jgi:hypothetical protein
MTTEARRKATNDRRKGVEGSSSPRRPKEAMFLPPMHRELGRQAAAGQPILSIRTRVDENDAARCIKDALKDIHTYMQEHHIDPAGPPFSICQPAGQHGIDVEAGWPLMRPVAGTGRIHGGSLPVMLLSSSTRSPLSHDTHTPPNDLPLD